MLTNNIIIDFRIFYLPTHTIIGYLKKEKNSFLVWHLESKFQLPQLNNIHAILFLLVFGMTLEIKKLRKKHFIILPISHENNLNRRVFEGFDFDQKSPPPF